MLKPIYLSKLVELSECIFKTLLKVRAHSELLIQMDVPNSDGGLSLR